MRRWPSPFRWFLQLAPLALMSMAFLVLPQGSWAQEGGETQVGGAQAPAGTPDRHSAQEGSAGVDHSAAAHGEEGDTNILAFQPALATYTLIVFALLLYVLWRYAWGPLSKALEAREHKLQHAFDEAERARNEAAALLEQHRQQMASAQDQVRAIIEEARRDAQSTADNILKKAQEEAEASRARAQREIGIAKDEALTEIWSKSADLAVSIAHKVLSRELSEEDHRRLIRSATEALPQATATSSRHGGNGR